MQHRCSLVVGVQGAELVTDQASMQNWSNNAIVLEILHSIMKFIKSLRLSPESGPAQELESIAEIRGMTLAWLT